MGERRARLGCYLRKAGKYTESRTGSRSGVREVGKEALDGFVGLHCWQIRYGCGLEVWFSGGSERGLRCLAKTSRSCLIWL